MKTLLTILLFIGCMNVNSQDLIESLAENLLLRNDLSVLKAELYRKLDEQSKEMKSRVIIIVEPDSSVCKERGHIKSSFGSSTLMNCPPYIVDYNDSTVMVYPNCNFTTYTCTRCGQEISEGGKESRVTIWRRKL